jgi:glycosyltransferase involved in cell wall biosynthesis
VYPLFSIIIPTFKRPEALKISLKSLTRQTVSSDAYEVIVVNNYPDLGIDDIVEHYKSQMQITGLNEDELGAHNARNLGSTVAKGKYLVFMDDDCEAHPAFLQHYSDAMALFKPIIAGGEIEIKWDQTPPAWIGDFEHLMGRINFGKDTFWLNSGRYVNGGNLLIDRQFFREIGGMEPDQVGRIILGAGDTALNFTANKYGHKVLWVGNAKVWHHQRKVINARACDLLRREFNNGIMITYEAHKEKQSNIFFSVARLAGKLLLMSAKRASIGIICCNKQSLISAGLLLGRIWGIQWFCIYSYRHKVN